MADSRPGAGKIQGEPDAWKCSRRRGTSKGYRPQLEGTPTSQIWNYWTIRNTLLQSMGLLRWLLAEGSPPCSLLGASPHGCLTAGQLASPGQDATERERELPKENRSLSSTVSELTCSSLCSSSSLSCSSLSKWALKGRGHTGCDHQKVGAIRGPLRVACHTK